MNPAANADPLRLNTLNKPLKSVIRKLSYSSDNQQDEECRYKNGVWKSPESQTKKSLYRHPPVCLIVQRYNYIGI